MPLAIQYTRRLTLTMVLCLQGQALNVGMVRTALVNHGEGHVRTMEEWLSGYKLKGKVSA